MRPRPTRSRTVLGLLVLASVTVLTLDARHDEGRSPVDPLRTAVGTVLGPVEYAASAALRPITGIPQHFADVGRLRERNAALEADAARLRARLRAATANAQRTTELAGIADLGDTAGFQLVPAQVVAMGPAQSFSRTVTIDAGTADGVVPDLTVVNADGLVGRVVDASRSFATVLLIVDGKSTIGGRLSASMELGFLDGSGDVTDAGTLELSLVDHTVSPAVGDSVVTWGSRNAAPYVAGVPIGQVVSVHSSPADLTESAQIRPYVDFSALDVVAVVTDTKQSADLAGGADR